MKCDECGCGILPPPPAGSEPTPFVHPATTPKWPLVLSIVGVIAALAVIAVALLPLFDGDDDEVRTGTTVEGVPTTVVPVGSVSSVPASSESPGTTATPATNVATSVASSAATSSAATSSTGVSSSTSSVAAAGSSSTSSTTPRTSTSGATTTTNANATTTAPAGFPSPVIVALVEATCTARDSTDSRGNPITFNPLLTVDGLPDTAWRCEGASIHEVLLYSLARPSDISVVAAIPGYAGADPYNRIDRFDQNRRVTSARWACLGANGNEVASATQIFEDDRRMQGMSVTGFTGCAKVLFEILDSSRPGNRDFAAVSEIGIYGPA